MKKIAFLSIIVWLLTGCDSFLDSDNLVKKDTSSFPETSADAMSALTGVYSVLPSVNVNQCTFLVSELLSDDRLGGGAGVDRGWAATDQLKKINDNMFPDFWKKMYQGIFRSNMLLETLDVVKTWEKPEQKDRIAAEARFLRAYFYFDLCRMFGTVPLVLTTEAVNNPRAKAEELYAQIADDLKFAINTLPDTPYKPSDNQLGHATKWAAQSLLARVYLFYTGYYKKESLPLPGGGTITKQEVIGWLDTCISSSGHGLVSGFGNLWPYANSATAPDYKFATDNNLLWVGDDKNPESIFSIKYSAMANHSTSIYYGNQPVLYFSIREQPDYENIFPFGQGWGAGTVSSNLVDEWEVAEPTDFRRAASVLDVNDPAENMKSYKWGGSMQIQETGYWQKKYIAVNAHQTKPDGKTACVNYSCILYGRTPDFQIDNTQDQVIIRYADVLLMMAELKQDVSYINRVRERAGLKPIPTYSEKALQNERRWELAFEGQRYYDLLRWGIAGEALSKQTGVKVKNNGVDGVMDMGNIAGRIQQTGGFMPIPQTQIDLSAGVLEQTPGWDNDALY